MKLRLSLLMLCSLFAFSALQVALGQVFTKQQFTDQDALLVIDQNGRVVYQWRADQLLIPASLTKLLTSYLAIEKWGLSHRFETDFYQIGTQLWVKGFGDPYLVAQEIDRIVVQLNKQGLNQIESIHVDASYFSDVPVPGHSSVADPYNAPLSAVAANFNTAFLQNIAGSLASAELQTPLTQTAKKIAASNKNLFSASNKVRVNLINSDNAQQYFAEILAIKLGFSAASIHINDELPTQAQQVYRHHNSHTLESVLIGAMKYSNNFIANQVFLKLAQDTTTRPLNFAFAQANIDHILKDEFSWQGATIKEGAGLSRNNKLSARQIDQILLLLQPYKNIFKQVASPSNAGAKVFAKTGTLNGISNYAGYIDLPQQEYRFVFMFNHSTPYGYRDRMLTKLVEQLSALESP